MYLLLVDLYIFFRGLLGSWQVLGSVITFPIQDCNVFFCQVVLLPSNLFAHPKKSHNNPKSINSVVGSHFVSAKKALLLPGIIKLPILKGSNTAHV